MKSQFSNPLAPSFDVFLHSFVSSFVELVSWLLNGNILMMC